MSTPFIGSLGLCVALTLVYNGTLAENETRCQRLLSLTEQREWRPPDDPLAEPRPYLVFRGIARAHELGVYKIVPFGHERPPSDKDLLQYGAVEYAGNAEASRREARNFGLSRPFAYHGADVLLDVDDVNALTRARAAAALGSADDYREEPWGRLVKRRAFERVGLLDKDAELAEARLAWREREAATRG